MSFRGVVAWFGGGVTALCVAFDASCATLTVGTTNDAGTGSLRQIIKSAAANDNINIGVTGLIALTNGELLIAHDLIIVGPGATNLALSGNHLGRIFQIAPNAIVSISDLTIRDGHAADGTNAPNPAGQNGDDGQDGGGAYNLGTLRLFRCAVEGNSAGNGGCGGVGGTGGNGGAIYNAGMLTIEACTFSSNAAGFGNGCFANGGTGGCGGAVFNVGTLTMTVSTLSGNFAGDGANGVFPGGSGGSGGHGGAVFNAGILNLLSCTIAGNRTGRGGSGANGGQFQRGGNGGNSGSGGGIYNSTPASAAHSANSLIALNTIGDYGRAGNGPAGIGFSGFFGTGLNITIEFASLGHNFLGFLEIGSRAGFTNGVNGDLVGDGSFLDPKIGPLRNNGGPTMTMALLPDSPALDAGMQNGLNTDERGRNRTFDDAAIANPAGGNGTDIGAFELQSPAAVFRRVTRTDTNVVLRLNTEVGQTYAIERKASLSPDAWNTFVQDLPGTGGELEVIDIGGALHQQHFYRARANPQ